MSIRVSCSGRYPGRSAIKAKKQTRTRHSCSFRRALPAAERNRSGSCAKCDHRASRCCVCGSDRNRAIEHSSPNPHPGFVFCSASGGPNCPDLWGTKLVQDLITRAFDSGESLQHSLQKQRIASRSRCQSRLQLGIGHRKTLPDGRQRIVIEIGLRAGIHVPAKPGHLFQRKMIK